VLKQREPINGKSVIPIYRNSKYGSSAALTTPIRITQKYDMYNSDVILEERRRRRPFHKERSFSNICQNTYL
jgi:hypothetical protein